jgi:hypothetical protein
VKFRISYLARENPTEMRMEDFDDLDEALRRHKEMEADKETYYNYGIHAVFDNEPTSGFDRMPYKGKASGKSYDPR